jgi:hypothetical protein
LAAKLTPRFNATEWLGFTLTLPSHQTAQLSSQLNPVEINSVLPSPIP